jgi:hypothetical protein
VACPNLFSFATSELSQDAMICWLAAWADPAYRAADDALHATATHFIDKLLERGGLQRPASYHSVRVHRPFHDIDVLLVLNGDTAVLIEDKTDTKEHSDQLPRYKEVVRRELKFPDERIAALYLKTGDQGNYGSVEQAGYRRVSRRDILDILAQGMRAGVKNDIFVDFQRYLQGVEASVESYRTESLDDWNLDWNRWKGFFLALQDRLDEGDWDYVPNPGGGFMGFWWHRRGDRYLQLENDKLCFKIEVFDKAQQKTKWLEWNDALMKRNGAREIRIKRPVRRPGRWMTVAVLEGDYRKPNGEGLLDLDGTVDVLQRAMCFMDDALATGR